MNIDFNTVGNKNTEEIFRDSSQKRTYAAKEPAPSLGYSLNLNSWKKGMMAYGKANENRESHGKKSLAESLQESGSYDAHTAHNYMAVMSNTMSEKDFNELQKEGCHPGKMEIKEAVTNLDRIKVTLAEAGVHVAGYTDNIDSEAVEAITGSKSMAKEILDSPISGNEAMESLNSYDLPATEENIKNVLAASELALSLQPLSDGGVTYLIENSLEPTIMNAYEAQYAVGTGELSAAQGYFSLDASGYYAEKAESTDLSSLSDRIDGIINEAGLPINEDTRTDAAWFIERGIPLEPSALQSYEDLKSIEIPLDKKALMNEMMDAISQGKSAENAYLIKDYRLIKKERILSETRLK
ncbi:MAG: hypothetical protein J6O55_02860, partial [Lachnospiraceae bacterium]|nr:hypothetical protein [Lachnospiraceae bacterium]